MARSDSVAKEPDDVGPIPLVIFIISLTDELSSVDNRVIPLAALDQNAGKRAGKINIVRPQFNGFTERLLSFVRPAQVITEKCSKNMPVFGVVRITLEKFAKGCFSFFRFGNYSKERIWHYRNN